MWKYHITCFGRIYCCFDNNIFLKNNFVPRLNKLIQLFDHLIHAKEFTKTDKII